MNTAGDNPVQLWQGDCLDLMSRVAPASVDLILCDLPYGTTNCRWDSVIHFEPLWANYKRILKPRGAVVLTASQPFTSALVMSNPKWFRYSWVWEKHKPSGHLNAKHQPMRAHEDVLVFAAHAPPYFPQGVRSITPRQITRTNPGGVFGMHGNASIQSITGYPRTVVKMPVDSPVVHPTQKPVALMEYLIRTYTNADELVLDNTMGSGTTGVAAKRTGRRFIGIERDAEYFRIASERIANEPTPLALEAS